MAITLIIEDGTGIDNANAYVDADYVTAYAELQGDTTWKNNASKHNLAIVQASQFLDLRYSDRYCGEIVSWTQGLLFPRTVNGTATGIPKPLKNAVAQLALQYLTDGILDLNANSDAAISSESVSVGNGAVTETKSYFKESAKTPFSNFAIADRFVNQLMQSVGCECRGKGSMFIEAYKG